MAERCYLYDLSSLPVLSGPTLAEGCVLSGLYSVTEIVDLTLGKRCALTGLSSVRAIKRVTMAEGCELYDLVSVVELEDLWMGGRCALRGLSGPMKKHLAAIRAAANQ